MLEQNDVHGAAGRAAFENNDVCRGPVNVAVITLSRIAACVRIGCLFNAVDLSAH